MSKKKKSRSAPIPSEQSPQAAVAEAPRIEAPAPKPVERTLMDSLQADTTPARILMLSAGMLAIPVVLSLLAKYVLIPLFLPGF